MTQENGKVTVVLTVPGMGQVSGTMTLAEIMAQKAGPAMEPAASPAPKTTGKAGG